MSTVKPRALFKKRDDPYAGADMEATRRMGALLAIAGTAIFAIVLPFAPPTNAIGDAGWAVAVAFAASSLVLARWLLRGTRWSFNAILAVSYLGVAQVALLVWLSGGLDSPYHEFYFLVLVYTACVHTPRRVLLFLAFLAVVAAAPLIYDGWDQVAAARKLLQMLLWTGLGLVATVFIGTVRAQRLGLRAEGEQASRLARVDPLTGLGNRRAFEEALDSECARARATARPLSLVVVDIDGFKAVNDNYGHLSGDECLRQVAKSVKRSLRDRDACFRWGGDEIVVLLPETDRARADEIAGRLRAAVEEQCVGPSGDALTIRSGASQLRAEMSGEDLLEAADRELIVEKGHPLPVRS
jgi:diguanylate cyclase (GGDEF)-like protein